MEIYDFNGFESGARDWRRVSWFGLRMFLAVCLWSLAGRDVSATPGSTTAEPPPPSTPREFFTAGTQQLRDRKLREAEASLEIALTSQQPRWQPPALYNLGYVRFGQGVEELKKGQKAG